jgi:hypothetical protein
MLLVKIICRSPAKPCFFFAIKDWNKINLEYNNTKVKYNNTKID